MTLWQNEKWLVLSNLFVCHYTLKKLSAAEASESVYMRDRINQLPDILIIESSKLYKRIENIEKWQYREKKIVEKGEIAINEQFFLFQQFFKCHLQQSSEH